MRCVCLPLCTQEMLCELFTPVETPEAPNRGFFKGLFGGGAQSLDREDLCECTRTQLHGSTTLNQAFTSSPLAHTTDHRAPVLELA